MAVKEESCLDFCAELEVQHWVCLDFWINRVAYFLFLIGLWFLTEHLFKFWLTFIMGNLYSDNNSQGSIRDLNLTYVKFNPPIIKVWLV